MQVLVSEVVLPGGWCSFCFYLLSLSSCCGCYLCWNCHSLFIVPNVGLFCDQKCLIAKLFYHVPRGVLCFLVTTSFEVVVPVGAPLVHSGVGCLCDGKLDVLYFAVK